MGETCIMQRTMPEEKKEADKTAVADDKQEKKDEVVVDEIKPDYDKQLQDEVEKFERAEKNREGYEKRKAKKDGEAEEEKPNDIESQVAAALAKELPKILPKLQSSLAEDSIETLLNEFSQGDESKKKLLRWNFENKVTASGTMRERMENAELITDKKAIQKKQSEMATALKNRAGLGASGLGSSTEGQKVGDNILSADQLNDLKALGWDDKKIERFKKNLRR